MYETREEDILIILGDVGIDLHLNERYIELKEELYQLPFTLFCIHGNHEERLELACTYEEKEWHGGLVYYEEDYPNIHFAMDGEVYDFQGKKVIVIDVAYSVDKFYRLARNIPWFSSEQAEDWIKDISQCIGKRKCLEVMAGLGALSYSLKMEGINIKPVDNYSWEEDNSIWKKDKSWIEIENLDAVESIEKYGRDVEIIIMSWPPYDEA